MQDGWDDFQGAVLPHRDLLHRRALQLESSRAAADDLVQDTVERALRAFSRLAKGSNARGWLLTIMNNTFIDGCRHRAVERVDASWRLAEVSAPEPEEPARWRVIAVEELHRVIPLLEPPAREIVSLYLSGVRSYRRLSARLGIPQSTVGTRLHRARRRLRRLLDERFPVREHGLSIS